MENAPKDKLEQYEIIKENNPMLDDYHVGIRSPKDIKSWEEVIKLCHYTNLQLLKAEDNLHKGAKLDYTL